MLPHLLMRAARLIPASAGEKKKKLRKKVKTSASDELDLDAMAAAEAAAGGNHASLASRAARAEEKVAAAAGLKVEKTAAFERALASADARSKAMEFEGMEVDGAPAAEEPVEEAEVDAELYAALARARRLSTKASSKASGGGGGAGGDDAAAAQVAEMISRSEQAMQQRGAEEEEGAVELSTLEFSQTGEFCKAVRAKDDEADTGADLPSVKFRAAKASAESGGMESSAVLRSGGGGAVGGVKREGDVKKEEGAEGEEGEEGKEGGEEDESDDEYNPLKDKQHGASFMYERKASGGMAAVLDMARNRGMLGEEESTAGRIFDTKGAGLHSYTGVSGHGGASGGHGEKEEKESSFQLDHYDEYGRKMTQKQVSPCNLPCNLPACI